MSEVLRSEQVGHVVRVTLNRPETGNMLNDELLIALADFFSTARAPQDVRTVVLTGAGDYFSNGVFKPTERGEMTREAALERVKRHHVVVEAIEAFPAPVIAAINGPARAGGFELLLACDLRIAADTFTFQLPETAWGVFPGAGAPVRLPRIVGAARAKEIMLTGRVVDAAEALAIGVVERVVKASDLATTVDALAQQIAGNAPLGNAAVKTIVNRGLETDLATASALSDAMRWPIEWTKDRDEGIRAFAENRKPVYQGE